MEKAFLKLIETVPAALITLGIIFLIVYLLREYRKVREETEASVKNIVNAKLGEFMSNIQSEASRIELLAAAQEPKMKKVEDNYLAFLSDVEEKSQQIDGLYKEATEKLLALKEQIPNVNEFSARDLVAIASSKDNSQTKAQLCKKVLTHPDATSKDLEVAGDIMEKSSRYSLALELYEAATNKDPERLSAFAEYMALRAVIEPSKRDQSFQQARERILKRPERNSFATIANAYMELDRYEELRDFSLSFIESLNDRDPKLKALALRNVAVSFKELGQIEESINYFGEAFHIYPEDPNILKPYLGILEEQGKIEEHVATAKKLVAADPGDIQYYRILVGSLIKRGMNEEALEYLARAHELPKSQMDEAQLKKYEMKARLGEANKKIQPTS